MAANVQPIITAILTRLKSDGNLRAHVGERIYHASIPEDVLLPVIVFQFADMPVVRYFDNSHAHPFLVDLDIILESAEAGALPVDALSSIEDRLATVLDRHTYTPTPTGYERVVSFIRQRGIRIREVDTLRSSTRATIWATTT